MPKIKLCETKVVEYSEYTDIDFREVSSFFIKNAFGDRVYFMTREREVAQATCDCTYGDKFYSVTSGKTSKNSGNNTVRGVLNSKSRQGHKTSGK